MHSSTSWLNVHVRVSARWSSIAWRVCLRDFGFDGSACLPLANYRRSTVWPCGATSSLFNADHIAAAKLAVDREIEQGRMSRSTGDLKSRPYRPDVFRLERRFGPDELALARWMPPRRQLLSRCSCLCSMACSDDYAEQTCEGRRGINAIEAKPTSAALRRPSQETATWAPRYFSPRDQAIGRASTRAGAPSDATIGSAPKKNSTRCPTKLSRFASCSAIRTPSPSKAR